MGKFRNIQHLYVTFGTNSICKRFDSLLVNQRIPACVEHRFLASFIKRLFILFSLNCVGIPVSIVQFQGYSPCGVGYKELSPYSSYMHTLKINCSLAFYNFQSATIHSSQIDVERQFYQNELGQTIHSFDINKW